MAEVINKLLNKSFVGGDYLIHIQEQTIVMESMVLAYGAKLSLAPQILHRFRKAQGIRWQMERLKAWQVHRGLWQLNCSMVGLLS